MKRVFSDLHIRPNGKDHALFVRLASKASELGYKLIAAQLPSETKPEEIQQLKKACADLGLDFASRVDIRPRSQNELLSTLRRVRRRFEIVCVLSETKEVARQAAKDQRVDLLNFPFMDYRRRFFDRAEAELASGGTAGLEIDTKPILTYEGPSRIRFLYCLRREIAVAREYKLPIVISSGASDPSLQRRPREVAMIASLFGLMGDAALDVVSENATAIVQKNRAKLKAGFVAPGIRVLKQGDDC